jgi:hypothetical protein
MQTRIRGFGDELVKAANFTQLVEKAIGKPGSPLRRAITRGALLGGGASGLAAAVAPLDEGEKRHLLGHTLAGAAAGALARRLNPHWFALG